MAILNDPLTGQAVRVTRDGEQLTLAVVESELEFVSHEKGLAFSIHSTYAATGGDEIASLENTNSDLDIIVDSVAVSTSATGVMFVFVVDAGLTPDGSSITPLNLNLGSSVLAQANAFGGAAVTGSLVGTTIAGHDMGTSAPHKFEFGGGLIMPKGSIIAVTALTTGTVHAEIVFHYAAKIEF